MKGRVDPRSRGVGLTWRVIAVIADGRGIGDCGHRHADDLDAVRCSWTPEPWPEVCDLIVRQVRDAHEQRRMPW